MDIPKDIQEKFFLDYQNTVNRLIGKISLPLAEYFRKKVEEMRGNFYIVYPFLFRSHYTDVKEEDFVSLTLSGNLYFSYLLLLDEFVDNDTDYSFIVALHLLHENAIRQLCKLFPAESIFWVFFEKYEKEFFTAISQENAIRTALLADNQPSQHDLLAIAQAKSAFAKCATAGLWVLSGCPEPTDPFILTQNYFHTAIQLLDDLQDWKKDYRKQRFSYLLSSVLSNIQLQGIVRNAGADDLEMLGKYIHYTGAAESLLELAISYFENALQSCRVYNVPHWKSLVKSYREKSASLRNDLSKTKQWLVEKTEKVKAIHSAASSVTEELSNRLKEIPYGKALASALSYILLEQQHGYPEMSHRMTLPCFDQMHLFTQGINVCGNLFQRTVVLDVLLDIQELQEDIFPKPILSRELTEIMNARTKGVRGGWNYFPEYPWLPPDTDDLAQVTRLFTRTNYNEGKALLDDSIDLLLSSNRYPNGTFRTWILDPSDTGMTQKILQKSVASHWGEYFGKDIEVTANMLQALWLYDSAKYSEVVTQGVAAVATAQIPPGIWRSVWYWNIYYGTYVAIRLLTATRMKLEILYPTKEYLIHDQHEDGGWGYQHSDPLSTALALLTFKLLEESGYGLNCEISDRGVAYLLHEQQSTGSWKRQPFIRMFVGNAQITYQSQTITTAFVLKALVRIAKEKKNDIKSGYVTQN